MIATGKIAKEAAKYTRQLCRAIVHGMTDEMYFRGIWKRGEVGLHAVTDEDVPSQVPTGVRADTMTTSQGSRCGTSL